MTESAKAERRSGGANSVRGVDICIAFCGVVVRKAVKTGIVLESVMVDECERKKLSGVSVTGKDEGDADSVGGRKAFWIMV